MNSLDVKNADETFNKQVFLNSVNLCTKVDAIKDVRVAIEACLHLTEAKPDFNMEMVANDVTEYNLFNGLLHVLDREKFLVVLGFLIQNTLFSELNSFGIESDPFHIKFEGEEKVSAIAAGTLGDVELEAKWQINEYTIAFTGYDGAEKCFQSTGIVRKTVPLRKAQRRISGGRALQTHTKDFALRGESGQRRDSGVR